MIWNVIQVQGVLDDYFPIKTRMCHIFLESLGNIQFIEDDSSHHDHHREGQDDQECLPSKGMSSMSTFPLKTMCNIYIWEA